MNSMELLSKLAATQGPLSVNDGVLWFEDGTSVDLTILSASAKEPTVVLTVSSEALGNIVVIAPEGMKVVDADALANKVSATLKCSGEAGDLDGALTAFERAGFDMPLFATVDC